MEKKSGMRAIWLILLLIGLVAFPPNGAMGSSPLDVLEQHEPGCDCPPGPCKCAKETSEPTGKSNEKFKEIVGTVRVSTSLNIRTSPWGTIIGKFHNNDKVKIIGTNGDWYKIEYQGRVAYVHKNYVSTSELSAGNVPVREPGSTASSSPPSTGPVPPAGNLQERVVSAAQNLVGQRNFPYAPATNGGRLGCAQVVSTALKNAGVLSRVSLGVLSVMGDLERAGWKRVSAPPFRSGDVITWSTYDRSGDGRNDPDTHIGVIMQSGNSVQAMSNSSSLRYPRLHAANYAPISHVLRKV